MKTTRPFGKAVRVEVSARKFQDEQSRAKSRPEFIEDTTRNAILFFTAVAIAGVVLYFCGFISLY